MNWRRIDTVNPELHSNLWDVFQWARSSNISLATALCWDCLHDWSLHSRGENGPCKEETCQCVGFLWAPEHNRPSAPRGWIVGPNVAPIDGYWE